MTWPEVTYADRKGHSTSSNPLLCDARRGTFDEAFFCSLIARLLRLALLSIQMLKENFVILGTLNASGFTKDSANILDPRFCPAKCFIGLPTCIRLIVLSPRKRVPLPSRMPWQQLCRHRSARTLIHLSVGSLSPESAVELRTCIPWKLYCCLWSWQYA